MFTKNKTLIAVVSYNDPVSLDRIVNLIDRNFYSIIIFDNSTDLYFISKIKNHSLKSNVNVLGSGINIGIGGALNRCVDYAFAHGYDWILTFDQDSMPESTQIVALTAAANKYPGIMSFASCSHGDVLDCDKLVSYSITSGNLVNVKAIMEVGGYDEDFFIDGIDFDISLKLRRRGYQIMKVANAKMHHIIGIPSNITMKNLTLPYAKHVAARRYYQTRNILILSFRYFKTFPFFISKLFTIFLCSSLLALIFDEQRLSTAKMIYFGFFDSITNKKRNFFN